MTYASPWPPAPDRPSVFVAPLPAREPGALLQGRARGGRSVVMDFFHVPQYDRLPKGFRKRSSFFRSRRVGRRPYAFGGLPHSSTPISSA
jgi:hypothetical protein